MKEWEYSDEYYIRRGVEAIYPKIQVVLISEIFKDSGSKVFSAYDPEFKFFLFKIKTPTGQTYQKHDSGGTGIYRISIPQNQLLTLQIAPLLENEHETFFRYIKLIEN